MSNELKTVNDNSVAVQQESSMANQIVQMAANPDFDVAKLDKLMELQEREMNRLAKIEFNKDFTAMQSEITTVSKSSKVEYKSKTGITTSYSFATLEDIVDTVRPVLERFGFAISFKVNTEQGVKVNCTLMHKDGHSIDTTMHLPADNSGGKNNVQALGSSISYAKRYTLSSLLNIATRDDDDAQAAMQKSQRVITGMQVNSLEKKYSKLPKERQKSFDAYLKRDFNVDSIAEIKESQFNTVLANLNKVVA